MHVYKYTSTSQPRLEWFKWNFYFCPIENVLVLIHIDKFPNLAEVHRISNTVNTQFRHIPHLDIISKSCCFFPWSGVARISRSRNFHIPLVTLKPDIAGRSSKRFFKPYSVLFLRQKKKKNSNVQYLNLPRIFYSGMASCQSIGRLRKIEQNDILHNVSDPSCFVRILFQRVKVLL